MSDLNTQSAATVRTPFIELSASEIKSMSKQANELLDWDRRFLSGQQLNVMASNLRGEEREFFAKAFNDVARVTKTMPVTYEQDDLGDAAVVHMHYFLNGSDWWITELDVEDKVSQAFGLVQLNGFEPELGYISISELIEFGAELDLHWTPITLKQVRETMLSPA